MYLTHAVAIQSSLLAHYIYIHLQLSLQRCMETFSSAATELYQMRRFCDDVVQAAVALGVRSHDVAGGVRYTSCRSYEAFANALHCCLDCLTESVRRMERIAVEHCELMLYTCTRGL